MKQKICDFLPERIFFRLTKAFYGKQALLGQFHVLFHTKIQKYDLDGKILNGSWLVYRSHFIYAWFSLSFIPIYWYILGQPVKAGTIFLLLLGWLVSGGSSDFFMKYDSLVFMKLVGARGFEPPTSTSRTSRSSQTEPRPEFPILYHKDKKETKKKPYR